MIRRPPRSTQSRSSAASDVYKRQLLDTHGIMTYSAANSQLRLTFTHVHRGVAVMHSGTVKSADRALDLLELFAEHLDGLSLTDVCEYTSWPKSSSLALL